MARPIVKKLKQSSLVSRSPTCPSLLAGKSYSFLIHHAQEALKGDPGQICFCISSCELSRFLGAEPAYFLPILDKLVDIKIRWDLLPQVGDRIIVHGISPMLGHFHYIRVGDGTYAIDYSFPEPLRQELLEPKYFRFLSLEEVMKFRGKYALKLYELCYSYLNPQKSSIRTPWFEEGKLRALLGCTSLYREMKSFKQWVLDPSLRELNAVSGISVRLLRQGRGSGHRQFQFYVQRKPRAKKSPEASTFTLDTLPPMSEKDRKLLADHLLKELQTLPGLREKNAPSCPAAPGS